MVELGEGLSWLWRREDGIEGVDFDFERFPNPVKDWVPVFLLQFHQRVRVFLMEATG